jgi:hypothetical protein
MAKGVDQITFAYGVRSSNKSSDSPTGRRILSAEIVSIVTSALSSWAAFHGDCSSTMASVKLNSNRQPAPTMATFIPSIEETEPNIRELQESLEKTDRIEADESFHLFKIRRAFSRGEWLFILTAEGLGIRNAILAAEGFRWDYQRPLKYLRRLIEIREGGAMAQNQQTGNTELGQYRNFAPLYSKSHVSVQLPGFRGISELCLRLLSIFNRQLSGSGILVATREPSTGAGPGG